MNSSVRQPAVPGHNLSSMLAIERIFRDSMVRLGCPQRRPTEVTTKATRPKSWTTPTMGSCQTMTEPMTQALANADGTDVPNPPPECEWWWGVRGGNWLNAQWPLAAQADLQARHH